MTISPGGPDRPPYAFAATAMVFAIAALVAVAPGGVPAWALLRDGGADRSAVLSYAAVMFGLGLVAAGAVTVLVHRLIIARRPAPPALRVTLLRAMPVVTATLVMLCLIAIARTYPDRDPEAGDQLFFTLESEGRKHGLWGIIDHRDPPVFAGENQMEDRAGEEVSEPGIIPPHLYAVFAILAVALAAVAVWQWSVARSQPRAATAADDDEPSDEYQQAVRGAVIDTIGLMLADPDPNTATIGAYARLLEGLAACGSGRRAHEAPMEHIRRVLTRLPVRPAPVRELIELFEMARFSTRPLGPAHRDRALEALRAVAADLEVTTGARVGSP